jgi:hypothetical protein
MHQILKRYHLLGITLASDFPFSYPLLLSKEAPDLTITQASESLVKWLPSGLTPLYTSPYLRPDGESVFQVYRLDDHDVLHFPGIADFFAFAGHIAYQPFLPVDYALIETFLLGIVMSYCLESRGTPILHASAVQVDDRLVAFIADSGGGKSTLAAALVRAGFLLVSDDILPIRRLDGQFLGCPSFPVLRMYPVQAQYFLGHLQGLQRMNDYTSKLLVALERDSFGAFCAAPRPLTCLFLPQRRDAVEAGTDIEITPLSSQQALKEIIRHTFAPRMIQALGLAPRRLAILAELARQVPMCSLVYPSGFEYLPAVQQILMEYLPSRHLSTNCLGEPLTK